MSGIHEKKLCRLPEVIRHQPTGTWQEQGTNKFGGGLREGKSRNDLYTPRKGRMGEKVERSGSRGALNPNFSTIKSGGVCRRKGLSIKGESRNGETTEKTKTRMRKCGGKKRSKRRKLSGE